MTSHAHRPSDSSAARITAYCGVAVALITTIGGILGLVFNRTSVDTRGSTSAAVTPTTAAASVSNGAPETGLRFSPLLNGKLTVSGSALKDIIGMYVLIGPKSSSGEYDVGCGNVVNQRWQTEVTTDASWPNYPLATVPAYDSCVAAAGVRAYKFTFQGTETTTPSSPDPILDCARRNGLNCFNGPGFAPPTTYRPNQ